MEKKQLNDTSRWNTNLNKLRYNCKNSELAEKARLMNSWHPLTNINNTPCRSINRSMVVNEDQNSLSTGNELWSILERGKTDLFTLVDKLHFTHLSISNHATPQALLDSVTKADKETLS